MSEGPSGPIDRAALERIIQRAAELQTAERDIGENLSADEVIALGKDVGIPARYLQQAMLEERTRLPVPTPTGLLDQVVGPGEVTAQRVMRGDPDRIEQQLLKWMEGNELLAVQRQQQGRISWEPLRGMHVALRRSAALLGSGRQLFMLEKASRVSATIGTLEPGYTLVALTAEARKARRSTLAGALAGVVAGSVAAAVLATMTPFWWVAAAPAVFFLGWAVMTLRQYPPVVERLQLGLERALDHLERGETRATPLPPEPRPSLIGLIADEVRRAMVQRPPR